MKTFKDLSYYYLFNFRTNKIIYAQELTQSSYDVYRYGVYPSADY